VNSRLNIVIDTNVLIAALRSDAGAAHRVLLLVGTNQFDVSVSVPLILEYEEVCLRLASQLSWTTEDVGDTLDYLCSAARQVEIHFKWPVLPDADDDMILELAVAAGAHCIVTFNKSDFVGAAQFGLRILTPFEFLEMLECDK
jgi:putative PIN family toxin of toxin-antitoxin system